VSAPQLKRLVVYGLKTPLTGSYNFVIVQWRHCIDSTILRRVKIIVDTITVTNIAKFMLPCVSYPHSFLAASLKATSPLAIDVTVAWSDRLSVCMCVSSITLIHRAKDVGRNEIPFGRDLLWPQAILC